MDVLTFITLMNLQNVTTQNTMQAVQQRDVKIEVLPMTEITLPIENSIGIPFPNGNVSYELLLGGKTLVLEE